MPTQRTNMGHIAIRVILSAKTERPSELASPAISEPSTSPPSIRFAHNARLTIHKGHTTSWNGLPYVDATPEETEHKGRTAVNAILTGATGGQDYTNVC